MRTCTHARLPPHTHTHTCTQTRTHTRTHARGGAAHLQRVENKLHCAPGITAFTVRVLHAPSPPLASSRLLSPPLASSRLLSPSLASSRLLSPLLASVLDDCRVQVWAFVAEVHGDGSAWCTRIGPPVHFGVLALLCAPGTLCRAVDCPSALPCPSPAVPGPCPSAPLPSRPAHNHLFRRLRCAVPCGRRSSVRRRRLGEDRWPLPLHNAQRGAAVGARHGCRAVQP
jgi:hypothetical protein